MLLTLNNPIERMHSLLKNYGDQRIENFPLMSTPFYTIAISLSYVYFVKVLGPKLMENRKPFNLREVLLAYNFVQVIFSIYLFYELAMSGWLTGEYSYKCQPVDYSNSPQAIRMLNVSYWYYIAKITELLDTIFFVMRKKYEQVTVLHVIHHGIMPVSTWLGIRFIPGGHGTFFGLLNCFVHIVMYSYYMLSALGPSVQKYLWWKKYLTTLQLVQFVFIMAHSFQLIFRDCNFPKAFVWMVGLHALMFFFLFKNFYNKNYIEKKTGVNEKRAKHKAS